MAPGRGQGSYAGRRPGRRSSATRAARASTSASSATATSSSRARRGSAAMFTGHITGLSSVDVKNDRRGRRLDRVDRLRRACCAWARRAPGAVPGPACYGRGGTEPTVTDAAVVLGYIDPDYFLGGRIKLDAERGRARRCGASVAEPLGLDLERAAWAILAVANEHMVTAIRDITINEGLDPRESIARRRRRRRRHDDRRGSPSELGCDRVLVPRTAGALSATGGLFSRRRRRSSRQPPRRHGPLRLSTRSTRVSAQLDAPDRRVLRPPATRAAEPRAQGVLRRGALPVPGLGARGAARRAAASTTSGDVERLVEALPRRPRARLRGARSPARRSSACTGRAARPPPARSRGCRASSARRRGPPTPERSCAEASFGHRRRRRRARATSAATLAAGQRIERAGDRRGADDDRRRLPGLVAATVTATGDYLLDQRRQPGMSAETAATELDPILLAVIANRLDASAAR